MADAYLKVKDNNGTLSLIREEADGSFADLKNAIIHDEMLLIGKYNLLENTTWESGKYIRADGTIGNASAYKLSGIVPVSAETKYTMLYTHTVGYTRLCAYDSSDNPLSVLVNASAAITDRFFTFVTPENTSYIRCSYQTGSVIYGVMEGDSIESQINSIYDRYIPFTTNGSNRGTYDDVSDIIKAYVTDDSYDMFLYFGNNQNTPWLKSINVSEYDSPRQLVLRKSDNSAMPAGSAVKIAEAVRQNSIALYSDIADESVKYVSTSGSDNNGGSTRNNPYATIQKAIDSGAKTILVKEGTYSNNVILQDKDGVSILLDHYYDTFRAGTDEDNPKIIIDGSTNSLQNGVNVFNCTNCHFGNIEVKNISQRGFNIQRSDSLRFDDCIAHDIGIGSSGSIGGFMITYTNADFYNCVCYNIGTTTAGQQANHYDGFNIHGTGTTNFINCSAWNCEDDGISHHDACCGMIDGGEWYNCGKGGIASPTHGAKINVSNVYCHNNYAGIYADNNDAVTDRGNIILSNCVCKNNSAYDVIVGDYYNAIAINCVYDTVNGAANITRFGIA